MRGRAAAAQAVLLSGICIALAQQMTAEKGIAGAKLEGAGLEAGSACRRWTIFERACPNLWSLPRHCQIEFASVLRLPDRYRVHSLLFGCCLDFWSLLLHRPVEPQERSLYRRGCREASSAEGVAEIASSHRLALSKAFAGLLTRLLQ